MNTNPFNIRTHWTPKNIDRNSYSFLNLYSLLQLYRGSRDYSSLTYLIDGSMSSVILGLVLGSRIQRYSFDFTSLANPVFEYCSESGAGVYFLGSSQSDLSEFLDVIKVRHPTLNIVGAANGYFDDEASDSRASDIIQSGAEVVILGMGAPKQDDFSISLRNAGFKGTSFTCGGFMHQTASSHGDYYPKIINRLNLRFIYRMLKEPNTIKRYCVDYPICLVYLIFGRLTGRLRMNIIDGAGQCQMR